jgi:uncharacterized protein YndB with AHSA1/START domain
VPENNETIAPIVQTVWVDCPVDEAFRVFTEGFADWWPHAEECEIEPWLGGRIFERAPDGKEEDWGSIIAWEPPGRLEFTWCPGRREDEQETVQVEFEVEADGTRVTLIHRGWNRNTDWNAGLSFFAMAARQAMVAC